MQTTDDAMNKLNDRSFKASLKCWEWSSLCVLLMLCSSQAPAADVESNQTGSKLAQITAKEIVVYFNGGLTNELKARIDSQGTAFQSKDHKKARTEIENAINTDPNQTALGLNDQSIDKIMSWLQGAGIVDPPAVTDKSLDSKKGQAAGSATGGSGVNRNFYLLRSPATNESYIFNLGIGYEHSEFDKSGDTYWLALSVYANNRAERSAEGWWNDVVKPDWYGEIAHSLIPSGTNANGGAVPTLGEGARVKFGLFWPLPYFSGEKSSSSVFNWNTNFNFADKGLHLSFGPTFNFGLEKVFNGNATNSVGFLAHNFYGGIRASLAPDTFVEYTVGDNRLLDDGIRYRLVMQTPIFYKSESGIRYYLRATWDTSKSKEKDILQFAIFVDVPLDMIFKPSQFLTLIPVLQ